MQRTSPRPAARIRPRSRAAFWVAAVLGTLHALWSLYWAFGGTLLLHTVGQWAVEAASETPVLAGLGLGLVSVAKLAGAWIPLLAESGRIPWRKVWRILAWIVGPALIVYGGADFLAGTAVLTGIVDMGVSDSAGLVGHAFIWGPHFALWGLALTLALWLSRRPAAP